jgi:alkylhydroperoxidase family enzyme
MAKHVGVTDAQIAAMDNWQNAKCFNELERAVLRFTDEVAGNVKASHEAMAALKKHLDATDIVELILSIGFWGMVAPLLETTEVDLEEYAGKVNLLAPGESS